MQRFYCRFLLFGILFPLCSGFLFGQSEINGFIKVDSTWSPTIYLSIIPNFDQLNSMSNQMIIDNAEIGKNRKFCFQTDYLPAKNHIYRIHFSKKGDPPASLIIGGRDENHMFFIANKNSEIKIQVRSSETLFGNIEFENSPRSQLLNEVNKMLLYVDTTSFYNTPLKRELMENALNQKLRQFADTCSFPLVALYAIYKSNFEENIEKNPQFYRDFLGKWKNNDSPYFIEFRKKVPKAETSKRYASIFLLGGLILGILCMLLLNKIKTKKTHNSLQELTLQERKIFALLQQQKSNKEISEELNISLSTVKSHVNSIFSKLDIKSRREVIQFKSH